MAEYLQTEGLLKYIKYILNIKQLRNFFILKCSHSESKSRKNSPIFDNLNDME